MTRITHHINYRGLSVLALAAAHFCVCSTASATITIPTVPVGDVSNPDDPAHGNLYGEVGYAYNIAKYEVTVGQYTAFLNAVAVTDTYGLYNPSMATDLNVAGISQSCSPNCTYSVIGSPNHPVTYVSWGDAARFANWLNNGQPTGPQNTGTTEDGAYSVNGATTDSALLLVTRKTNATWFIPTESEWYKAAYYQPAVKGGDSDSYWEYPMKTNTVPFSDGPPGATPDNTRVGNFYSDDRTANGYDDGYAVTGSSNLIPDGNQNYLTDVGAYTSSPGYYGTFDQGGNVFEWNETVVSTLGSSYRGARGGSWNEGGFDYLRAANRPAFVNPTLENGLVGFRVASIPEPGCLMLCAAGILVLAFRKGRK